MLMCGRGVEGSMQKLFVSVAILALAACQPAETPKPAVKPDDFSALVQEPKTAEQLAAEIRTKAVTAEAVTQGYLDRIATVDDAGPMLNAVLALNPSALEDARALDAETAKGQ